MPNWKKVITSGSNAHLNQLTASNFQFTGTGDAELDVDGHITASGNISASGTIEANGDFIVNSAGRVGINTTSPDYKLDVAGNVGVNEYIYHNGDPDTYLRYQTNQVDLSAGGQVASLDTTRFTTPGHITASGAQLNGEFKVGVDGTGHDVKFFGDTSARLVHFDADNNIMKFYDNTILGIGTGPSATLGDTTIKSDGSETDILTSVGTTMIRSTANDGNITIKTQTNGAGNINLITDAHSVGTNTGVVKVSGSAENGVKFLVYGDTQLTGSGNLYGSGSYLNILNDGTAPSEIRLHCEDNAQHYIGIRGPVHAGASSYVLKLPNDAPSDNQILKVNGSPSGGEVTLAWESDGGGGGGGVSFPTTDVISSSTDLFIGSTQGAFVSASTGNIETSGSGRGQLQVDYRFFDTGSTHLSTGGGGVGDVVRFGTVGGSVASGDLVYLKTDGTWDRTRNSVAASSTGSLGVALGTSAVNDGVLLRGFVSCSAIDTSLGQPVFVGDALGKVDDTAPTDDGDIVRIVGHYYGNGLIYFNPDSTFIEVA